MWLEGLFSSDWVQDLVATFATFAVSLAWLRIMDSLAARGAFSHDVSRKIIHIGTGPLFIFCWNLFSSAPHARWLAALVPLAITLQFAAVGLGLMEDPAAVAAMSRSGDRREILHGPLYYGIIFVLATVIFWRATPIGIVALMILCGGDGMAGIAGSRWGTARLPWTPSKSWIGSAVMFMGSFTFSLLMSLAFRSWGYFEPSPTAGQILLAVGIVSVVATMIESLPLDRIDNITVFVGSTLASILLVEPLGVWNARLWTL